MTSNGIFAILENLKERIKAIFNKRGKQKMFEFSKALRFFFM